MDEVNSNGVLDLMRGWHFVNQVYTPFHDTTSDFDTDKDNSFMVINNVIKTLQRKKKSVFFQSFATRLLVHILGDMHQPLHNVDLFSNLFPNGEHGGNNIKVKMNVDESKLK